MEKDSNLADDARASEYEQDAASVELSVDPEYLDDDTNSLLDQYLGIAPSADASEAPEVEVESEESEEPTDELETAAEDGAEESPTEDEDAEDDSEDSPPNEGDLSVIDLSELTDSDVFEFEIHGKTVHWNKTELLNQIKRSESASELSREVKAKSEALEQERAVLDADREKMAKQATLANITPELAKARNAQAELHAQYNQAVEEENSLDLPIIRAKLEKAAGHTQMLEQAHQNTAAQLRQQHVDQQKQILVNKGLGHIIEKGLESPTMKFMQESLSPDAFGIASLDATMVALAEDARLWRESQNKGAKPVKKRSANKTLTGRKGIAPTSKRKQTSEPVAQAGHLDEDTDALLNQYLAGRT